MKKYHIKSFLISQAVVCCAFLASCGNSDKTPSGWSDETNVEILVVADGSNLCERDYVGSISSENETDLGFTLGGTLTKMAVSNGQRVSKGQLLAEVDATTAKSLHATALATLHQAEDAYDRLKKVHEGGGISDVRWKQMETDLEKARQSELAARKNAEASVLRAPFSGVVSCENHHIGEELKPLEPIVRLVDLTKPNVRFSVPEQDVGLLEVGSTAVATIPALDNRELTIKITDKGIIANPLGHTYRVSGKIVNGDIGGLLPDMVAKVHAVLSRSQGIILPTNSVQIMPEGSIVWVVQGGKAYHRLVSVSDFVENGVIIDSGLNTGDTVIISGHQKLYTAAKVNCNE